MPIKIDYRGKGIGRYLEIDKEDWNMERFGLLNSQEKGEISMEELEDLEKSSEELEYQETSYTLLEKIGQRIYGGAIRTPHGTRGWIGEIPEDVEEYLEEVRSAGVGI